MSQDNSKSLIKSLTFGAVFLLFIFNLVGQDTFDNIYIYLDEIVNTVLTITAVYGRYRASEKIKRII